jgi:hypothetical protein
VLVTTGGSAAAPVIHVRSPQQDRRVLAANAEKGRPNK